MTIVVRPAAAADIEAAYRWYQHQRPGLGTEFLVALRDARARILENPEAYRVFHRQARRVRLKRFPYFLAYRVYSETIVVVGCLHGRRDPVVWKSRVDG